MEEELRRNGRLLILIFITYFSAVALLNISVLLSVGVSSLMRHYQPMTIYYMTYMAFQWLIIYNGCKTEIFYESSFRIVILDPTIGTISVTIVFRVYFSHLLFIRIIYFYYLFSHRRPIQ